VPLGRVGPCFTKLSRNRSAQPIASGRAGEGIDIAVVSSEGCGVAGKRKLADRIEHVAENSGRWTRPYGHSFVRKVNGRERFIEVKTTRFRSSSLHSLRPGNEVNVSERIAETRSSLYRLFKFQRAAPGFFRFTRRFTPSRADLMQCSFLLFQRDAFSSGLLTGMKQVGGSTSLNTRVCTPWPQNFDGGRVVFTIDCAGPSISSTSCLRRRRGTKTRVFQQKGPDVNLVIRSHDGRKHAMTAQVIVCEAKIRGRAARGWRFHDGAPSAAMLPRRCAERRDCLHRLGGIKQYRQNQPAKDTFGICSVNPSVSGRN